MEIGEGPPIVLLHGLGQDYLAWYRLVPALTPHYRLIAPRVARSGRRPLPERYERATKVLLADLADAGLLPVTVMGHSLGAHVAVMEALDTPESISHLILLAPAGMSPPPPLWRLTPLLIPVEQVLGPVMNALPPDVRKVLLTELHVRRVYVRTPPRRAIETDLLSSGRLTFAQATANARHTVSWLATHPVQERLLELTCPIYVIWGHNDIVIPPNAEMLSTAGAIVATIENCGHSPHLERPNEVVDILSQWGFLTTQ